MQVEESEKTWVCRPHPPLTGSEALGKLPSLPLTLSFFICKRISQVEPAEQVAGVGGMGKVVRKCNLQFKGRVW